MSTETFITAEQQARERALALAVTLDIVIVLAMGLVGVIGGSLTLLSDGIRAGLGTVLEYFTYVVIRRIHRGSLADLDYGTGKLEQVANLVIASGMLMATVWIIFSVLRLLTGERTLGTPIGLAVAAILGSVSACENLVAWDAMRRAATSGDSLIMQTQVVMRRTKLIASVVVLVGMTVAAMSTDDLIVTWTDALGSLFVAIYMSRTAWQVLKHTAPDLMDRSAGRGIQQTVAGVLASHADAYTRVCGIRSRRSGQTAFVEIALEFEPGLSISDVTLRVDALKTSMRESLGNVEVSILPSAAAIG